MKTLVILTLFTLAIAEPPRSVDKPKDKRAPVGQSSLNGGGGGGGGSYSSPSSSYGTPSSQYSSPSSQYGSPSLQYSGHNLGYLGAPGASYLSNSVAAAPGHSFGALSYGLQNLAYVPSQMYSLPAINLPISAGAAAYSHGHGGSPADLSALFQQSYLLQPAVHNLFTPQFDLTSLYSGIGPAYHQQLGALPAATKLGPVTFGVGHGGLADLALYNNAAQLAQTYQTPSHPAYSSGGAAGLSSGSSSYSGPSSAYASSGSSAYSSGSSQYSQSSPSNSYSSPSSGHSSVSGGSAYSSPAYSSPAYSSPSYSSPSSSYSSPSSSYSSPSSSYGAPSSSAYNTISYSKP